MPSLLYICTKKKFLFNENVYSCFKKGSSTKFEGKQSYQKISYCQLYLYCILIFSFILFYFVFIYILDLLEKLPVLGISEDDVTGQDIHVQRILKPLSSYPWKDQKSFEEASFQPEEQHLCDNQFQKQGHLDPSCSSNTNDNEHNTPKEISYTKPHPPSSQRPHSVSYNCSVSNVRYFPTKHNFLKGPTRSVSERQIITFQPTCSKRRRFRSRSLDAHTRHCFALEDLNVHSSTVSKHMDISDSSSVSILMNQWSSTEEFSSMNHIEKPNISSDDGCHSQQSLVMDRGDVQKDGYTALTTAATTKRLPDKSSLDVLNLQCIPKLRHYSFSDSNVSLSHAPYQIDELTHSPYSFHSGRLPPISQRSSPTSPGSIQE